jgi:hypothetical protein
MTQDDGVSRRKGALCPGARGAIGVGSLPGNIFLGAEAVAALRSVAQGAFRTNRINAALPMRSVFATFLDDISSTKLLCL